MRQTRRSFLKHTAAAGLAFPFLGTAVQSAQAAKDVVRHASFGAAGMAGADLGAITSHPSVKLVCVAEVDLARAADVKKSHPDCRVYQDWREMLDKEAKNLDSVNVSTPDHMHAPMAMSAMQLGLHVYGQKPLTHDVYETRRLTEFAAEKKLVTQMGIQVHSDTTYRMAVALIQAGAIGPVREVHTWSSKKWGDNSPRPDRTDPVPETLNWDLWLGVCSERPFIKGYYHPGDWRRRLDFGTGTFGDMGCHILDPVFNALQLTAPTTVRAEGPKPNEHNWATDAIVHFQFPATKQTTAEGVKLTWYDGDQRPSKDVLAILEKREVPDQGSLFLGAKGAMLLPHVAAPVLLPEKDFEGYSRPELAPQNHWHQFVEAVRGNGTTSAHFGYSGPLTETVLLGGVATFFPKTTLEWDAPALQFKNSPEATAKIRRPYRSGWEVAGLS